MELAFSLDHGDAEAGDVSGDNEGAREDVDTGGGASAGGAGVKLARTQQVQTGIEAEMAMEPVSSTASSEAPVASKPMNDDYDEEWSTSPSCRATSR
ncbi:hypothetical protein CF326_g9584 [Tilletia indica]|uniref:Uncharacterized protein n=1 Tax=Tilletia indica TaxID=43049 RepID=A0A177SZ06_9BASI|nr:hypothetical protein CF326_g9584 [Tilletia indica]KAE8235383.1 hypothetical protein A4X13_0g9515 [Tilletia indica]